MDKNINNRIVTGSKNVPTERNFFKLTELVKVA